jgi:hypothetical protein
VEVRKIQEEILDTGGEPQAEDGEASRRKTLRVVDVHSRAAGSEPDVV